MSWVRVKATDTGHEYDVHSTAIDPAAHTPLKSKEWPDLDDAQGPRPAITEFTDPVNTKKKES